MKNKLIILSIAVSSFIVDSCNNGNVSPTEGKTEIVYKGKEMTTEYDAEIEKLISQMTLEEKIGMLHGNSMFSTRGVERLGIPELKMADGPLGVREEISLLFYLEMVVMLNEVLTPHLSFTRETMESQMESMWWWILPHAPKALEILFTGREREFLTYFLQEFYQRNWENLK